MKFHEWLLETGNRQELDSLIPNTIASLKDATRPEPETQGDKDSTHMSNGAAVRQSPMAC